MQTSRFQLGLIAALSGGLGLSLASSLAIGYPAGAAVSLGANPVWSAGGELEGDGTVLLPVDIPEGQVAVVTDVVFSVKHNATDCAGHVQFELQTGGETAAAIAVPAASWYRRTSTGYSANYGYGHTMLEGQTVVPVQLRSGVQAHPGDGLTLSMDAEVTCSDSVPTGVYTVSGYYAQA